MLSAVQLYDELLLEAGKIDNISAYGRLAPEFAAGELTIANAIPEALLGIGLSSA